MNAIAKCGGIVPRTTYGDHVGTIRVIDRPSSARSIRINDGSGGRWWRTIRTLAFEPPDGASFGDEDDEARKAGIDWWTGVVGR